MKLHHLLPCLLALGAVHAAPLTATTAVLNRPEAEGQAIGILKAGTEPTPAAAAPEGWMAVSLPGPFTAYVHNSDLTKALDVVPGSSLFLQPKSDATVLTVAAKGDKLQITGVSGPWTQVSLNQPVIGYIHTGPGALPPPAAMNPAVTGPGPDASAAPSTPAPVSTAAGHPVDDSVANPGPQFFEGRFVAVHTLLGPKRPYDWQLVDADNRRIAFLDVSKLLPVEQMDRYIGHEVSVYGAIAGIPKSHDVVVAVENLQLK